MNFRKWRDATEEMPVDESEVWKQKNLMSVDNIRKLEKVVYLFMLVASVLWLRHVFMPIFSTLLFNVNSQHYRF